MAFKLSRKGVYIGTIVTMVAMIGGLAVAAVSGIVFTPGTGNQNFGSFNAGNTIYASATVTMTLVSGDGLSSGCLLAATYAASTADIPVAGIGSTCLATNTWYDELTFTVPSVPASASDTFWIAVNGGPAGAGFTVTSASTFTPGTLHIYVDNGPTTGAPGITSLSITVTGT